MPRGVRSVEFRLTTARRRGSAGNGNDAARARCVARDRDGTTHIVLEPLDLIARLAALVPPPRVHLTRFHGVFAAHAALRAAITPAGRGPGARCGGRLQVIASIEEPELIERILAHRRERGEEAAPTASLGARGPPQASLF
jgi:hypothetical protein